MVTAATASSIQQLPTAISNFSPSTSHLASVVSNNINNDAPCPAASSSIYANDSNSAYAPNYGYNTAFKPSYGAPPLNAIAGVVAPLFGSAP